MELPKNIDMHNVEKKWMKFWEEKQVNKFDPDTNKEIYTIDTPPPTVSGKMHIGHAFSFSQADFIARYKKLKGFELFYPFGTDDNGLPTDKLVEKLKKVNSASMPRDEYVKLCLETIKEITPDFVFDWKQLGISCDFNINYSTIDPYCQKISQKSFLDLYKTGRHYRKEAPTLWCPTCRQAIAQVELEDKELDSTFNDIIFKLPDDKELIIATTRPELLPSCVSIFFHPHDERYKKYEGLSAKVPLFNHEVLIRSDERVDMEKGTGIVMCCTFGDQTDMEWYFQYDIPLREGISFDGKMTKLAGKYEGLKIKEARLKILKDLEDQKLLVNKKPIKHIVNIHERCGNEIEILHSKQWFLKYLDIKDDLLKAGDKLKWFPNHMKNRYDNWIKGLKWDWCVSRQRHFGIPIPVWYCKDCDEIIYPDDKDLPVDPLTDKSPVDKCPKCACLELVPEKDIFDTWATSSLSPKLAADLFKDHPVYEKLYPMNLRPQAHDIISFWLFNTVVKSQLHDGHNPWSDCMISGWALDPHGKKMSKSKGNVVDPRLMHDKYCSDAIRFWASGSKLGEDLPFQEKDLVTANKVIKKLFNATKFALMQIGEGYSNEKPDEIEVIDKWILTKLSKVIKNSTEYFDNYEYSRAKMEIEQFFWHDLCDNYLEIIKDRMYNVLNWGESAVNSGKYALYNSFLSVLKMLAPIMPFITEELYHYQFDKVEGIDSMHRTMWPEEFLIDEKCEDSGDLLVDVLGVVRKYKSDKNVSQKTELNKIVIDLSKKEELMVVIEDLKSVTKSKKIVFESVSDGFETAKFGLKVKILD